MSDTVQEVLEDIELPDAEELMEEIEIPERLLPDPEVESTEEVEPEPEKKPKAKKAKAAKAEEEETEEPQSYKVNPSIINRLLENGYGSGSSRLVRMKAAGLDPNYVHKALAQLLTEVRDGKWGNERLRYKNLRAAGYDAVLVRREIMKKR